MFKTKLSNIHFKKGRHKTHDLCSFDDKLIRYHFVGPLV